MLMMKSSGPGNALLTTTVYKHLLHNTAMFSKVRDGRLSVSSYDDPRWYEQPKADEGYIPLPDEQSTPASAANTNTSIQQKEPTIVPSPDKKPRLDRIFRQIVVTTALVIIAFLAGWFSHQAITGTTFNPSDQSKSYANLIQQAWNVVDQNYVDRKAINYQQMSYQAIHAMLNVLNDTGHTRFLTPQDVRAEKQQLSGTVVGIGVYLQQDAKTKQLIITSTIPDAPAEKAGLKRGDIIVAINGVNTVGKDINAVSSLIQGPAGTNVSVTVKRPSINQTLIFRMKREEIKVPTVILLYCRESYRAYPDHSIL